MDVVLPSQLQFAVATFFPFLFVLLTLKEMLVVALIFVPIGVAYQIWTYRLFKGQGYRKGPGVRGSLLILPLLFPFQPRWFPRFPRGIFCRWRQK